MLNLVQQHLMALQNTLPDVVAEDRVNDRVRKPRAKSRRKPRIKPGIEKAGVPLQFGRSNMANIAPESHEESDDEVWLRGLLQARRSGGLSNKMASAASARQ